MKGVCPIWAEVASWGGEVQLPTGLLCKVTVKLRLEAGDGLPLQSSSRECGLGGGQHLERVESLYVFRLLLLLLLLFNIYLCMFGCGGSALLHGLFSSCVTQSLL